MSEATTALETAPEFASDKPTLEKTIAGALAELRRNQGIDPCHENVIIEQHLVEITGWLETRAKNRAQRKADKKRAKE